MTDSTERIRENVRYVVGALLRQELVIFLGAGANLSDRPDGSVWNRERGDLPSGSELSSHLWHRFLDQSETIEVRPSDDLATVAQAVVLELGAGPLYAELRGLLDVKSPITGLHRLLASLPAKLDRLGGPRTTDASFRPLLLVSTNYDDLMERAFAEAGQRFHMYTYEADGPQKGAFFYRSPDGRERPVGRPSLRNPISVDEHPVLMKFHGGLHRTDRDRDSFVITEDHYIEYLARTAAPPHLPLAVNSLLERRHVLFLGHALRDWNLRVVLYQLWKDNLEWQSWAIQKEPKPLERKFWNSKRVEILDHPLAGYVTLVEERLREAQEEHT